MPFDIAGKVRRLPRLWPEFNVVDADEISALRQKQTWRQALAMSALPPKADIGWRRLDVCFVPIADIGHQGTMRLAVIFERLCRTAAMLIRLMHLVMRDLYENSIFPDERNYNRRCSTIQPGPRKPCVQSFIAANSRHLRLS
jgi:hypothetical protein